MAFLAAAVVNIIGGGVIYLTGGLAASVIGPWLGFSSNGIVAGSLAASAQSSYGNLVSGSVISMMTSAAMTNPLGLLAKVVLYIVVGLAGAGMWFIKKLK